MMHSCLYHGWVRHRRFEPVHNEFRYRVFFAYLDLDELDCVFSGRWFWSTSRAAIARFRRSDHFGSPDKSLSESVRDLVEEQTSSRPTGPIRVLTQLRFWGYMMNPVSFFYCFNEAGTEVESVVAEVTNTPWGERHCYVLDHATLTGTGPNTRKDFHVSPFMEMNMEYAWKVGAPGETLSMHIDEPVLDNRGSLRGPTRHSQPDSRGSQQSTTTLDVSMQLSRRSITGPGLAKTLITHPFMTGRIAAAIYWQALKLWWKGVPFVPHPNRTSKQQGTDHEGTAQSSNVSGPLTQSQQPPALATTPTNPQLTSTP